LQQIIQLEDEYETFNTYTLPRGRKRKNYTSCPILVNIYISFHSLVSNCLSLMLTLTHYCQPPVPWNGGTGFVSKEMIQTHCPAPAQDIQVGIQISKFINLLELFV